MVEYLEDFARDNQLDVRFRTRVDRIDRDGSGWLLTTSTGEIAADHVVVAAGYDHTFTVPGWPGRDEFEGRLIHSAEYQNPETFRGHDVLVVGPGCSGMEIAYDLVEGGAGRVAPRGADASEHHPREPLGALFARLVLKLPTSWADGITRFVRRKKFGDLTEFGLPVPEEGPASRLKRPRVAPAIVDQEVIAAIREGKILIVPAVESLDEECVAGRRQPHQAGRRDRRDRVPHPAGAHGGAPRRARRARRADRDQRRGPAGTPVRGLHPAPRPDGAHGLRGEGRGPPG